MDRSFFARPFAHRGLHDAAQRRPENSLSAVDAACRAGCAIEIDVQFSADGEAMVFHDGTLDRMTGATGPLNAQTAAQLGGLALTGGDGETIPTLAQLLEVVAGRTPLLVEIKDQGGRFDATGVGPLERRVAAILAGYAGPVAAMSFNPESVAELARIAPALPRGLVAGSEAAYPDSLSADGRRALAEMKEFDRIGAEFASYEAAALSGPACANLRARGVPLICWTIRDAGAGRAALTQSDQITFEGYLPTGPRA